jgi:hypothetical protein
MPPEVAAFVAVTVLVTLTLSAVILAFTVASTAGQIGSAVAKELRSDCGCHQRPR